MQYILYLHGFHSSPLSEKAMLFKRYIEQYHDDLEVIAPQISVLPNQAIEQVTEVYRQYSDKIIGLVGSSMGGYLSTHLHNRFELPAVVINPAVRPFELLAAYLGDQVHPITNESYRLEESHMDDLKGVYSEQLSAPSKVWLLQQEQDEVLDYRQAVDHYKECQVTCEPGGSHGFDGFERYLGDIVAFLRSKQ